VFAHTYIVWVCVCKLEFIVPSQPSTVKKMLLQAIHFTVHISTNHDKFKLIQVGRGWNQSVLCTVSQIKKK